MSKVIVRYLVGIVALACVSYVAWLHYELLISRNETLTVQEDYDKFKGEINDQIQKNKFETAKKEADQREKAAIEKRNLENANRRLVDAIKRLRDTKDMSRGTDMLLADRSPSTMPGASTDTRGTIETFGITAGIRKTAFYESAMKDTLQCSRLIQFIRANIQKTE